MSGYATIEGPSTPHLIGAVETYHNQSEFVP